MKSVSFSNDINVRTMEYRVFLQENSNLSTDEIMALDLKGLRVEVDKLLPIMITQTVMTATGSTKRVTKIA